MDPIGAVLERGNVCDREESIEPLERARWEILYL
jgi:hypothetical protein